MGGGGGGRGESFQDNLQGNLYPSDKMGWESKIGEVHITSPSPLRWVENFQFKILKSRFSSSGETGGSPH